MSRIKRRHGGTVAPLLYVMIGVALVGLLVAVNTVMVTAIAYRLVDCSVQQTPLPERPESNDDEGFGIRLRDLIPE